MSFTLSEKNNLQRGTPVFARAYREVVAAEEQYAEPFRRNPYSTLPYHLASNSSDGPKGRAKRDCSLVTESVSQLKYSLASEKKLDDRKEPPIPSVIIESAHEGASKVETGCSVNDLLQGYLAVKQEKLQKLCILARKGEDLGTKQRKVSDSAHNKETSSKKNRDANNRPVDEEKLQYLYKNAARWDVAQYRSDLKDAQYEFPQKKLDRIRLMSEDQKMEYIEALHKDNKYIGDLAVEARSGQQRLAAENEFLKQKLEDMQKKLDMMQALYARKLK